jgi:hypothetical protein
MIGERLLDFAGITKGKRGWQRKFVCKLLTNAIRKNGSGMAIFNMILIMLL